MAHYDKTDNHTLALDEEEEEKEQKENIPQKSLKGINTKLYNFIQAL